VVSSETVLSVCCVVHTYPAPHCGGNLRLLCVQMTVLTQKNNLFLRLIILHFFLFL